MHPIPGIEHVSRETGKIDERIVDNLAKNAFPNDAALVGIDPGWLPARSGGREEPGQPVRPGMDHGREPCELATRPLSFVELGNQ